MTAVAQITGKIWLIAAVLSLSSGLGSGQGAQAQTLNDALAAAYNSNPTLLAARAELRSVNEGVAQALSNWRPSLSGGASTGQRTSESAGIGSDTTTPNDVFIAAKQPLYRGGRTIAGVARAENEVLAQRARLRSVEQTVLLQAATAYMNVWRDQSVLQLNVNNEQVLKRQLEASQDRFTVGEITRTDVAQSESRLARAVSERITAEGDLTSSRAAYKEIVGSLPGVLNSISSISNLPATQASVVSSAVDNNPDVVSAKFSERAATHQVREVVGELLPEVNLTGQLRHLKEAAGSGSESNSAQILAEVSVPLYQQGSVSSRVRAAKQVSSQRRYEIAAVRRQAEQQGISAWENLQTARAQIQSFQAEVRASEIALEGVRQENAVGARTILDILDAEQELLDGQVNLVRVQRDEVVAGFEVLSAVGQLTARDLSLPVDHYDLEANYKAVRGKWFGLGTTEQD